MCMFNTPTPKAPIIPPEPAQAKQPDGGAIRDSVTRRMTDKMRGAADTLLTSGSGVTTGAATGTKTLLGQ